MSENNECNCLCVKSLKPSSVLEPVLEYHPSTSQPYMQSICLYASTKRIFPCLLPLTKIFLNNIQLYTKYIFCSGCQCLCISYISSCPNACSDLNILSLLYKYLLVHIKIVRDQFKHLHILNCTTYTNSGMIQKKM